MSAPPDALSTLLSAATEAALAFQGAMAARITVPLNGHPADIVGLAFPPDVSIALYPSPYSRPSRPPLS